MSSLLSFVIFWRNASTFAKSSRIFFRAKDTEHFLEQVSIKAFYFKKNNDGRLSIFFRKWYFVIFCCKFVLKYILFIFTPKRNVNLFKDMLWWYKTPKRKTKQRNKTIAKEQLLLVHWNKVGSFCLVLCICILLLPKYIVCCNFCAGIYFCHFNNEETC